MKKPKTVPPPTRPLYALFLVVTALLLWLLAQPHPGLRVIRLHPVLAAEKSAPAPAIPDRIRIATYNLENFTDGRNDTPERTPEIFMTHAHDAAAIISEANPDILMLEEIENARTLEYLNEQFTNAYPYIYISKLRSSSGEKDKLNLALFSRLRPSQVRQLGFYDLAGLGRPARGSLSAEFDLGDGSQLLTYGIHLKSNFGEAPRNQAQRSIALHHIAADAISENLRNFPDPTSIVILGDTNVDPDTPAFASDPSLEPLAGSYVDLWRGRPIEERTTIPMRLAGETGDPLMVFPPAAFDRVFVSHNLAGNGPWNALPPQTLQKGTDTTNNLTPPGVNGHVSDHHLVYVDLIRNPDYVPPPSREYGQP